MACMMTYCYKASASKLLPFVHRFVIITMCTYNQSKETRCLIMKKILIISYLFAPMATIGAVRWTKIAKYLTQMGYDISVLTTSARAAEDELLVRDARHIGRIIRIDHKDSRFDSTVYYTDAQKAKATAGAPQKKSLVRRIKDAVWKSRLLKYPISVHVARNTDRRSIDFAEQAKKYISEQMDMTAFDAVICTYGPASGAMLACWIKKKYPDIPVIMDFRDPMANHFVPQPYYGKYKRIQKKTCMTADRVIAVTEDLGASICPGSLAGKCSVIPNGYDPEDFAGLQPTTTDKYAFVYTGAIYKDFADFSPLFTVLRELASEGEIDLGDIAVHYIGRNGAIIEDQAAACNMSSVIINHGTLPREQTLSWQKGARYLLLTIWNNKNDGGYRPGKLLEYMASGRPVIGLVNGDAGNSILRRTVEQGGFGIAYESVTAQEDIRTLREYILSDYRRWKQGLEPELSPDTEYIDSFGYPHIAEQVAGLIEKI